MIFNSGICLHVQGTKGTSTEVTILGGQPSRAGTGAELAGLDPTGTSASRMGFPSSEFSVPHSPRVRWVP